MNPLAASSKIYQIDIEQLSKIHIKQRIQLFLKTLMESAFGDELDRYVITGSIPGTLNFNITLNNGRAINVYIKIDIGQLTFDDSVQEELASRALNRLYSESNKTQTV